jgi:hypothetical protein
MLLPMVLVRPADKEASAEPALGLASDASDADRHTHPEACARVQWPGRRFYSRAGGKTGAAYGAQRNSPAVVADEGASQGVIRGRTFRGADPCQSTPKDWTLLRAASLIQVKRGGRCSVVLAESHAEYSQLR